MTAKRIRGSTRNRYLLRAQHRAERRNPNLGEESEAIRLVRAALAKAGARGDPPHLDRLNHLLGIVDVRYAPLPGQGRLVLEDGGFIIEIDESLDSASRTFTHAHELGHLILEGRRMARCQGVGATVRVDSKTRYLRTEELCDLAAEEIVLPETWVRDQFGSQLPSLDDMRALGKSTGAGVSLVVRRLLSLWGLGRLIEWSLAKHGWVPTTTFPDKDTSYLEMISLRDRSLLNDALGSSQVVTGHLGLEVYGESQHYSAEAVRLGLASVLTLLRYG